MQEDVAHDLYSKKEKHIQATVEEVARALHKQGFSETEAKEAKELTEAWVKACSKMLVLMSTCDLEGAVASNADSDTSGGFLASLTRIVRYPFERLVASLGARAKYNSFLTEVRRHAFEKKELGCPVDFPQQSCLHGCQNSLADVTAEITRLRKRHHDNNPKHAEAVIAAVLKQQGNSWTGTTMAVAAWIVFVCAVCAKYLYAQVKKEKEPYRTRLAECLRSHGYRACFQMWKDEVQAVAENNFPGLRESIEKRGRLKAAHVRRERTLRALRAVQSTARSMIDVLAAVTFYPVLILTFKSSGGTSIRARFGGILNTYFVAVTGFVLAIVSV